MTKRMCKGNYPDFLAGVLKRTFQLLYLHDVLVKIYLGFDSQSSIPCSPLFPYRCLSISPPFSLPLYLYVCQPLSLSLSLPSSFKTCYCQGILTASETPLLNAQLSFQPYYFRETCSDFAKGIAKFSTLRGTSAKTSCCVTYCSSQQTKLFSFQHQPYTILHNVCFADQRSSLQELHQKLQHLVIIFYNMFHYCQYS